MQHEDAFVIIMSFVNMLNLRISFLLCSMALPELGGNLSCAQFGILFCLSASLSIRSPPQDGAVL